MYTYMTVYKNEVRTLEVLVRDQYDLAFNPDMAYARVEDVSGNIILAESTCMIQANKIYTTLSTTVTSVPSVYHVVWRVIKNELVYYHKSIITVKEI